MTVATKAAVNRAVRTMRVCEECAKIFTPWRGDQRFCEVRCNRAWHSRNQSRSAELIPVAMNWRKERGAGPVKLGHVTTMLDRFIMDDRARERAIAKARADLRKVQAEIRAKAHA